VSSGGPRPSRAPVQGYSGPKWIQLCILTSGIRAEGQKNMGEHLRGHMVTGEPVNVTVGSREWFVIGDTTRN
jgi:hypothetical protein